MFPQLLKYKDTSSFKFRPTDSLANVCNAPETKSGIYLVYSSGQDLSGLIYIGSSGHINNDGSIHVRTSGFGGIKDRIVNGHQFNKEKRYICWPKQMVSESISELEIHWYVTHNSEFIDSPCYVEHCLLQNYFDLKKQLPRWNKKF